MVSTFPETVLAGLAAPTATGCASGSSRGRESASPSSGVQISPVGRRPRNTVLSGWPAPIFARTMCAARRAEAPFHLSRAVARGRNRVALELTARHRQRSAGSARNRDLNPRHCSARLAAKKSGELLSRFGREHAAGNLGVMVQALLGEQIDHAPQAPVLGSAAPYTRRAMRACMIAPAHMTQGSSVTYRVQPPSR